MAKQKGKPKTEARVSDSPPAHIGLVQQSPPPTLDRVVFCFKYLDATHKTFTIDQLPRQFGKWLLNRFCGYGKMLFGEFAPLKGNPSIHSHRAAVERIEAHGGFKMIPEDLWQERPWQILIQGRSCRRVFLVSLPCTIFSSAQ